MVNSKLIFALDIEINGKIKELLKQLPQILSWVKIGFQAFSSLGPDCFKELTENGYNVFLDLKFHDIPNTVARDVGTMTKRGAHMINMHASGGCEMMSAARESAERAAKESGISRPTLLGVTVLTSMDQPGFQKVFNSQRQLREQVITLAKQAQKAGLDGVCASPLEIKAIREACGEDFLIVTPGIRPAEWVDKGDQRRFTTPAEAIQQGADYIVVGRPILEAADPFKAALNICNEIDKA